MMNATAPGRGRVIAASIRRLSRPLIPEWEPGVGRLDLIVVELRSSEGDTGAGFAWTPGVGAAAIEAVIRDDLVPIILGEWVAPDELWQRMRDRTRALGAEGPSFLAMAAIDMAIWDLLGRSNEMSLTQMLGQRRESVPVYRSGINFYRPMTDIVREAEAWAEKGATGVKIKIGRPELQDDIALIEKVRRAVGIDCQLMVDVNRRWSLDRALAAVEQLADLDITWLEEPLADPHPGAVGRLRAHRDIPLAAGENLYSVEAFEALCREGAIDIVQPNVARVGGITPFLRISELCHASGRQLIPHLLPELAGQLALTLPDPSMVELADGYTFTELNFLQGPAPVTVAAERMESSGLTGLGLTFYDY